MSFRVEPGQMVALVGSSGAGKSTIAALVPRTYDVDGGAVRLAGIDVRDLAFGSLRETVGMVPQDGHLFHDSIRGNLFLSRPDAWDEELWHVLARARLADLVASPPDGLDTVVGERGYRLSPAVRRTVEHVRSSFGEEAWVNRMHPDLPHDEVLDTRTSTPTTSPSRRTACAAPCSASRVLENELGRCERARTRATGCTRRMAGRGAGPDFVEALARGLDVLACFDAHHCSMSLCEAAAAAGLARPTARRLLLTLEELGFVRVVAGSFEVTPNVMSLGMSYVASQRLWDIGRPDMESSSHRPVSRRPWRGSTARTSSTSLAPTCRPPRSAPGRTAADQRRTGRIIGSAASVRPGRMCRQLSCTRACARTVCQ